MVGCAGVSRRRRAEIAEGVVAGQRGGVDRARRCREGGHVAQMVAVGVGEDSRRGSHLLLHGHHLPGKAVGRSRDVVAARRVVDFVVGEGGVDLRFGCAGTVGRQHAITDVSRFSTLNMGMWPAPAC